MPACLQFAQSWTDSAGTTLTVEFAAPIEIGSLLVCQVGLDKAAGVPSPSAGWTLLEAVQNDDDVAAGVAWRVADGTAADVCTWTWASAAIGTGWVEEYPPGSSVVDSAVFSTDGVSQGTLDMSISTPAGSWTVLGSVHLDSYYGTSAWGANPSSWSGGFVGIDDSNEQASTPVDGGGQIAELSGSGTGGASTTWTYYSTDQMIGFLVVLDVVAVADPVVWAFGDGATDAFNCYMAARRLTAVDHFLYLGDVYGPIATEYDPLYGAAAAVDLRGVTWPMQGNHGDWGEYQSYWHTELSGRPGISLATDSRYAFTINGWRLIVINTEENGGVGNGIGAAAEAWLDAELSAAAGKAIVCGHRPRYSPGDEAVDDRGDDPDLAPMWSLIEGRAVAYVSGHCHANALMPAVNGLVQIVAGAGGSGHQSLTENSAAGTSVFADATDYGALRMRLRSDRIDFQFIRALDGAAVHSFTLEAPEPPSAGAGGMLMMGAA